MVYDYWYFCPYNTLVAKFESEKLSSFQFNIDC